MTRIVQPFLPAPAPLTRKQSLQAERTGGQTPVRYRPDRLTNVPKDQGDEAEAASDISKTGETSTSRNALLLQA
jgi:hypothetical protein